MTSRCFAIVLLWIGVSPGCDLDASLSMRTPTRRLTAEEWQNTVQDLLGVNVPQHLLPEDELTAGFPNNVSGAVGEFDAENYLIAAERAAAEASTDLSERLGCETITRDCARAWASTFLPRAYRRPVSAPQLDRLMAVYDGATDPDTGVRLMITAALMSGRFLYRPETKGEPHGDQVLLDDFEIASRLSYLLWRSMPDETLFDAAREGKLSTAPEIAEQATRMLDDPRAERGLASFHLDWLGISDTDRLDRIAPGTEEERRTFLETPLEDWTVSGTLSPGLDGTEPTLVAAPGRVLALHGAELGPRFTLRGRMMTADPQGKVGIRFPIAHPKDDRDIQLVRTVNGQLVLQSAGCHVETGIMMQASAWMELEVRGVVRNLETEITVRVWPEDQPPPLSPTAQCRDASTRRGTLGLAAEGTAIAQWADLRLRAERPLEIDFDRFAQAHLAETRAFIGAWAAEDGRISTLLTADWTMANDIVAKTYRLPTSLGPDLVRTPLPPERVGLLTHPLFLATFAKPNQSSPVLRGLTIRDRVLCQVLPPPPADAAIVPPDPAPGLTTRERFAAHTEVPSCAGCHVMIDPVGHGLEGFNQFGVHRAREQGQPVDTSGYLADAGDATGEFTDVRGMVELLADSDMVRSCIVRNWYRNAMGHLEPHDEDPTLRRALRACRDERCTVRDIVLALVTSERFRSRGAHDGDQP